jgi:hypothetical protein
MVIISNIATINEIDMAHDDITAKTLGEWWAVKDIASITPDR